MSDNAEDKNLRVSISRTDRRLIIEENDYRCHYCGLEGSRYSDADCEPWHIDHKHPVSLGGSNDLSNLTLSCRSCNLEKSNTPYEEFISHTPDLAKAVCDELRHFQKFVMGEVDRGDRPTYRLYQRTDDVDMDQWKVLAEFTVHDGSRFIITDLMRALRRLYVLANRVKEDYETSSSAFYEENLEGNNEEQEK
jgi:hypothetical protein